MELSVALVAAGNTTPREVSEITADAIETLRGMRQVETVSPVKGASPDGAKGIADEIGQFLLNIPPAAITGVFGVLSGLIARAPAMTTVEVTGQGGLKMSFDPRRATPEQMAEIGKTLLAAAHQAG